ncbi:hypothetical protein [Thiobacillus sp.]|uniref:hypothetical protein n=1 Tax=Thiobacillus sp. TaxID=924 RepID=UPI0025F2BB44|nr:hypothetical protein [Thiobacillus sp.]MBT9538558.1 hypothetical protein [Thiobacillus sp.]
MSAKLDLNTFLDQTFFGIDTLTMLGDVDDFIEFSESNIGWQKHRELRRAEQKCNDTEFDDPRLEAQYRDQILEGVEYRFDVSLTQRVRYAGLIALITTVEWVVLALKRQSAFEFPTKPKKKNEAAHVLSVLSREAALGLEQKIVLLETLSQVRNCIVHAAGLLASYQYQPELRQALIALPGIKVSNLNFLGDSIEIEAGFLEGLIKDVRVWLPNVEKAVSERGLLRK